MRSGATEVLSTSLDKSVRVELHALHRWGPAFKTCGYVGLGVSVFSVVALAIELGLSPWFMGGIAGSAVLTFLALAMATKMVTGEENLTYYHHGIAVMLVATLLLRVLRQPVLPYLDLTMIGTGLFLACGRVGCLMVGCCHGGPHRWGVCYRQEHAEAGFPSYLVGVRLFPVQAMESLWVFAIVIAGAVLVLSGHPPGTAFGWYVVTYSVGRFWFEFMRGDPGRAYFGGFSEAQWTSLLIACAVSGAGLAGLLPFHWWHAAAAIALLCTLAVVVLRRRLRKTPKHLLLHPRHVEEVAEVIKALSEVVAESRGTCKCGSPSVHVQIGCTSLGVQVSGGQLDGANGPVHHYALSNRAGNMTRETAQVLAGLVLQLQRASGRSEIVGGSRKVFHLLYTRASSEDCWKNRLAG